MTNTELKSIRKALDLSKTDFAKAIGISPVMEGKYEKGSREIPDSVSQAAYELLNTGEQEPEPVVDEGDVFEDEEEAASAAYETPAWDTISASVTEETAASAVEEVTSPADDDSSVEEVTPAAEDSSAEEVTPAAEDSSAEEITTAAEDSSAEEVITAAEDSSAEEVTTAAEDSSAEEVTPAADADQTSVDVSASAAEETAVLTEKAPAEEKKKAAAVNTSSAEDDADAVNWGAAVLPFFVPPLLITQCLFNIGFMLSPKKRGFFGPWW